MDRTPRWNLIRKIRRRIAKGDYEDAQILDMVVDRVLEQLRLASPRSPTYHVDEVPDGEAPTQSETGP